MSPAFSFPQRVVCLTEETTETLYLLGEQDRIVGISGFTVRPKEARSKPKVSAFTSARIDKILDLRPDLVFGFSNLQADIARDLIRAGVNVFVFNQRSVDEILDMILTISRIVGAESRGAELIQTYRDGLGEIQANAGLFPSRPCVFFEEWMDPLISGIRWVEELVEISGGTTAFPELRTEHDGARRIVSPAAVVERDPEVVIASWCGRKVQKQNIRSRPGWDRIRAVRSGNIFEVKSSYILQPGPAALTEGVRQLHALLAAVVGVSVPPNLRPLEKIDSRIS